MNNPVVMVALCQLGVLLVPLSVKLLILIIICFPSS